MPTAKEVFSFHYDSVAPLLYGIARKSLPSVEAADKILTLVFLSLRDNLYLNTTKTISNLVLFRMLTQVISETYPDCKVNLKSAVMADQEIITITSDQIFDYSHLSIDFEVDAEEYQFCVTKLWRYRARQKMNDSLLASREPIARYNQLAHQCRLANSSEARVLMSEMKSAAIKWRTELDNYKRVSGVYNSSALIAF